MPALILKQDRADERGEAGDMAYVGGGGGDNPLTVSLSPLPSESNDLQQNWKGVEPFYIDMNMI